MRSRSRIATGVIIAIIVGIIGWRTVTTRGEASRGEAERALGCFNVLPALLSDGSGLDLSGDGGTVDRTPCNEQHTIEVYLIDRYPENTDFPDNPDDPADQAASAHARQTCFDAVPAYTGEGISGSRLTLFVINPHRTDWRDGDRSFFCGLADSADSRGIPASRTASLRDSLRGDRPGAIRCVRHVAEGGSDYLSYVDCAVPHSGEYVGAIVPRASDDEAGLSARCDELAAAYLRLTPAQFAARDDLDGVVLNGPLGIQSEDDPSVHCFVADPLRRHVLEGSLNRP
jgi:hypothetical protein